ncbi:hypothetical protein Raf01_06550 [Rugosimonospora africana]|uniref:Uncharacterized protein n=2 Tax=Rugosimonospora africana TaxID=556532 RepID=A0A8J3QK68_9ACTN|nr:hypothetical protein Raf01_06550 [Rugosimonospora africana]
MLFSWWDGRRIADTVTERLDPNLPVTVNLIIVHGLARVTNVNGRRVGLTSEGKSLAARLDTEVELLRGEKEFLARLAPLSDRRITEVLNAVRL